MYTGQVRWTVSVHTVRYSLLYLSAKFDGNLFCDQFNLKKKNIWLTFFAGSVYNDSDRLKFGNDQSLGVFRSSRGLGV